MSTERSQDRTPYQASKESILQILFKKFHLSNDDLTFFEQQRTEANTVMGLDGVRDDFPNGQQLDEDKKLGRNNVYSVSFGHRKREGQWTEEPAIILFVARKAPLEIVEKEFQAPEIARKFFDNRFATDVYELKVVRATPQDSK